MKFTGARGITRSRVSLIAALALTAIGLAGCTGDQGKTGPAGPPSDVPGPTGPTGPGVDVIASTKPESCGTCHSGDGQELHQAVYNKYTDKSNLGLTLDKIESQGADPGPYTVTLSFTITRNGQPYLDSNTLPTMGSGGQRTFYVTLYNSATGRFEKTAQMPATKSAASCVPGSINQESGAITVCTADGAVSDTGGKYHITATGFPYKPEAPVAPYTGAVAYGYIALGAEKLAVESYAKANQHYALYDNMVSASLPIGDAGTASATKYVSTANVGACESCHGKPYRKHGYREAQVAGLPDFVACKTCHFDTRIGTDKIWQQMLDDPYAWATGVELPEDAPGQPPTKYAYTANLMNDTHMSHAMEFPYPQSMANCNTCHAGKLDKVLTDKNFTLTTCKSCHAVDGKDAWKGQKYDETKRAPAIEEIWTAANVKAFHTIDDDCTTCHKATGIAPTFKAYHSGYDPMIYVAAGTKYNTLYSASVDSVTFDKTTNVMNIKFSATNTATKPTVTVSFYGYDTKDFYISGHTADGHTGSDATTACYSSRQAKWVGCTLEYKAGGNGNDTADVASTYDNNLLFTEVATGTPGKWEVNVDLTKYVQPGSTKSPTTSSSTIAGIPALITNGTIKKAEVAVLPSLKIGTQVVAIDAVSKTVDLATSDLSTTYFSDITSVAKCNTCHDALGTTFHDPSYGGSITVCRTCHQVTNGGSHLEMQSRSIDSYAHAIHAFQYFDTNGVDFAEPVEKARYERHIEHTFPNFTILSCQGCHNSGKFNVPDQSKSMPSLLSASYALTNTDRAIGTVPQYVTGAAGRACAGCHRAEMINTDAAGDLASLNSHVEQNGFLIDNTSPNSYLYGVLDKIMGYFK